MDIIFVIYFCLTCTAIYPLKLYFSSEFLFETMSKIGTHYFLNLYGQLEVFLFKIKTPFLRVNLPLLAEHLIKCSHLSLPSGSTSLEIFSASDVAISVLAAVTARMMEFGLLMNRRMSSLIWSSISLGWSPTGTWTRDKQGTSNKNKFISSPI